METRRFCIAAVLVLGLGLLALIAAALPALAAPQALSLDAIVGEIACMGATTSYNERLWSASALGTEVPGVELGPDHTQHANAGQTIVYDHVVTNTGTTTDTFLLEFTSTQHWPKATGRGLPDRDANASTPSWPANDGIPPSQFNHPIKRRWH